MMDSSSPNVRSATVGGWEGVGSGLSGVTEDENLVLLRVTFELSSLVMCFKPFYHERLVGESSVVELRKSREDEGKHF